MVEPRRPRHHRPAGRLGAHRRLRAARGSRLRLHHERAARRRHRHPLRDALRHARALAHPLPGSRFSADDRRDRGRGHAVHPAQLGLHRAARSRRRLRHSRTSVDRREPSDRPVQLSAHAERRPGPGRLPPAMAGPDRLQHPLHRGLRMGMDREVPHARADAAGRCNLRRVRSRRHDRVVARPRRRRQAGRVRPHRRDRLRAAAAFRPVRRGCAGIRIAHAPALRLSAVDRGRARRRRLHAWSALAARARRRERRPRVRDLDGEIVDSGGMARNPRLDRCFRRSLPGLRDPRAVGCRLRSFAPLLHDRSADRARRDEGLAAAHLRSGVRPSCRDGCGSRLARARPALHDRRVLHDRGRSDLVHEVPDR